MRILYMDDDPGMARLLQKHLSRAGYEVEIATDGKTGLSRHRATPFDFLIMDYRMPGLSGIEVLRELSKGGNLPPCVLLTGAGDEKTAVEAMKLGASDYILKDTDGGYRELMPSVIQRALHQRQLVVDKKRAEEKLRTAYAELEAKTLNLEELNITLKVLFKKREEDQCEMEENIVSNVKKFILPCLDKLKNMVTDRNQRTVLELMETHVSEIISPFAKKLSLKCVDFTPAEVRIAEMIRQDKLTKEIADVLNISDSAIIFHRNNIRKKLGLVNKKISLKSYLQTLE
jgi:FixJ family two-component response regulator